MAAINSLLFFLTTLAPIPEPSEDSPHSSAFPPWVPDWVPPYIPPTTPYDTSDDSSAFPPWVPDWVPPYIPPSSPYDTSNDWHRGPKPAENTIDDRSNIEDRPCFPNLPLLGPFQCPTGEHYQRCGSVCPPDCHGSACPYNCCVEGCFCDEGLIRGSDGPCISEEECPKDSAMQASRFCPKDEEYQRCGTACPRNCTNFDQDVPCTMQCVQGCFCKYTLVRGPNGRCIPTDACPVEPSDSQETSEFEVPEKHIYSPSEMNMIPQELDSSQDSEERSLTSDAFPVFCKVNEEFSFFNSLCPDNCDNYKNHFRPCNLIKFPGCKCKGGYVRDTNRTCIKKEQCEDERPSNCTDTENFDNCGSYCEPDCTNIEYIPQPCMDKRCKKGCFCKPGLVRGPNWECVPSQECLATKS